MYIVKLASSAVVLLLCIIYYNLSFILFTGNVEITALFTSIDAYHETTR